MQKSRNETVAHIYLEFHCRFWIKTTAKSRHAVLLRRVVALKPLVTAEYPGHIFLVVILLWTLQASSGLNACLGVPLEVVPGEQDPLVDVAAPLF